MQAAGMKSRGLVVAAHAQAAQAGVHVLREGGNAVDAAVATAAALSVVDPANCGLAGYGGFMVVQRPSDPAPSCVDFNTAVPAAFEPGSLARAGRTGPFVHGGPSASVPCVLAGLDAAHRAFGSRPWADLFEPAIGLARDGVVVGSDLERSLAWTARRHGGLNDEFRRVFLRDGRAPDPAAVLRQPELAQTLGAVAAQRGEALRSGPIAQAISACVASHGGPLGLQDLASARAQVGPAERAACARSAVFGPDRDGSAFGVLDDALAALEGVELGSARGPDYIARLAAALHGAWQRRRAAWSLLIAEPRHTSHFCTADAQGGLVSCTFTQGPLWFGSGLVAPGTGLVINAGANLYARRRGEREVRALTNLTPTILLGADGSRHAIGSPGGQRIPAIVLQAVLDVSRYGIALDEAIGLPRLSVDEQGALEVESALGTLAPDARTLEPSVYYGPAGGISILASGAVVAAPDPRFAASSAQFA